MVNMHPLEAYEFLCTKAAAILVDVRSEVEYLFVGHAEAAIHVPWYVEPDWEINPTFIESLINKIGNRERPIIFICRNGSRSKEAGLHAEENGFTQVFNVLYGFEGDIDQRNRRSQTNGWRYEGLPWEQC